jgi:hypothetical protein
MKRLLLIILLTPLFLFAQTNSCESISGFIEDLEFLNPVPTTSFANGWNMFGFVCPNPLDVISAFESIQDNVVIVKDNVGNAYLPDWGFNGIGVLMQGYGYQIKMNTYVVDYSFCSNWINISTVEGCTDCESSNFNPLATVDDGTCDLAAYQIGDYAFGGLIFYLDETGEHGLVAASSDFGNHEWACNNENVYGAYDASIGAGESNTENIVNDLACYGDYTAAQFCYDLSTAGFSDWFLPSKDELSLIYTNLFVTGISEFSDNVHWSSTTSSSSYSWGHSFQNGTAGIYMKGSANIVRPVRSF